MNPAQVKKWLSDNELELHRYGCGMQIISSAIHSIAHQGSASALRAGLENC